MSEFTEEEEEWVRRAVDDAPLMDEARARRIGVILASAKRSQVDSGRSDSYAG